MARSDSLQMVVPAELPRPCLHYRCSWLSQPAAPPPPRYCALAALLPVPGNLHPAAMWARAWEQAPRRAPLLQLLLLLAALLLFSTTQAAATEAQLAPAPAQEAAAPSPSAAARPSPPPPPADDLAAAEATLLEADGDGPTSLAGALPDDVTVLIGDSAAQTNGEGSKQPAVELPPVGERQGGQASRLILLELHLRLGPVACNARRLSGSTVAHEAPASPLFPLVLLFLCRPAGVHPAPAARRCSSPSHRCTEGSHSRAAEGSPGHCHGGVSAVGAWPEQAAAGKGWGGRVGRSRHSLPPALPS